MQRCSCAGGITLWPGLYLPVLRTSDLEYDLPEDRIARVPAERRDSARMLVVRRTGSAPPEHRLVRDLPEYLRAGDCMVLNQTRVLPARFEGVRADTGGRVEGLYLGGEVGHGGTRVWRVLVQGKRLREGVKVRVEGPAGDVIMLCLLTHLEGEPGGWRAELEDAPALSDAELLARIGLTPIPPYIRRARRHAALEVPDSVDRERYQTVFASGEGASVAAPTAGLHLTPELLALIEARGVTRADVTLHVGTGTFRSVETEFVEHHAMHTEACCMDAAARGAILRTRSPVGEGGGGGRVLCVGTTAARTVESFAALHERARAHGTPTPAAGTHDIGWSATNILIAPGYQWLWTDALLTNFHLPRSTLMAMVASMLHGEVARVGSGVARLKDLYATALREGYRFYSYGDAMLILPE